MTKETIAKLPTHIVYKLEEFRKDYKNTALQKDETRARAAGYVMGLRDAGIISERERQILFVYCTV